MSRYALRQAPKPSKRALEASEGLVNSRPAKKRKPVPKRLAKSKISVEAVEDGQEGQSSIRSEDKPTAGPVIPSTASDAKDRKRSQGGTTVSAPSKRTLEASEKPLPVRPSKRKKTVPKQPIPSRKVKFDVETSSTQDGPFQTSRQNSTDYEKAHKALDASIKAHLAANPLPKRKVLTHLKKAITPVNVARLRSIAAARGPQLTPDGRGMDLSPTSLPSPVTPRVYGETPTTPITKLKKKIARGRSPPSYWPFDIVSGGKPPNVTVQEQKFWGERVGAPWEQEELPDRYGRLWRCIKIVNAGFVDEIRWDQESTLKADGKDLSPKSYPDVGAMTEGEYKAFERDVESFLGAFGEEEPEWAVMQEVEGLGFGEDD
jgi:hypothetical protein